MTAPEVELSESHEARVGALTVRRALPRRQRRTIGAWCFVDHIGPADIEPSPAIDTAPHPHIGLQTVTWLLEGEIVHHDSLGTEQPIRPGQLNLMTAAHGIAHSEEQFGRHSHRVHGVQLWVAMPEATRHGAPAFEHHGDLPQIELANATATVLVGEASPARRDTDHFGLDVALHGGSSVLELDPGHEHGIVVTSGAVEIDGNLVTPGHLAYLARGRDELALAATEPARLMLLGGTPFESKISMFWNFVARTHDEIDEAVDQWQAGHDRFGEVPSQLPKIPSPLPPWR